MDIGSGRTTPKNGRPFSAGSLAAGGTALLIGGMALAMPETALQASLRGVSVWWEVLFPALFPFFVLSELLLGFGIVHFAGTLLDPLMRPLFRLPGAGGFVVAMGFASGYPVGARLTSRLMEQKWVNRSEGERLVEITTTSDPIFLIGAVSVGFFGRPEAVPVLAIAHYGGAILMGILGRWRRGDEDEAGSPDRSRHLPPPAGGRLRAALAAMHHARVADGRPFSVLLQQAVQSSLGLMVIVGGLVVFFSTALDLLLQSGALGFLKHVFAALLQMAGMPPGLYPAFIQGTFEVTLGARASAQASGALPLVDRLAAAAFVLSWAGLSVHAQVAGLMSRTSWRYGRFARTRLLHGILATAIVYLIWPFFQPGSSNAAPVWLNADYAPPFGWLNADYAPPFGWILWPLLMAAALLLFLASAGGIAWLLRRIRSSFGEK